MALSTRTYLILFLLFIPRCISRSHRQFLLISKLLIGILRLPHRIFFSAFAQGLVEAHKSQGPLTPSEWATTISLALSKLYTYTRARPPSRTLVDPLAAFVDTLQQNKANPDFAAAVKAAGDAALKTRDLEAKAGRSAYVEGDRLRQERVPDPGAWGVKVLLEGLLG